MKRTVTRYAMIHAAAGHIVCWSNVDATPCEGYLIVPVTCTYDDGRKPPRKRKTKKARKP